MLSKESKIRVLENFYALDYVFFGKPVSKVGACCPLVKEEYLSIKGALLSVYHEMLKLMEHSPAKSPEKIGSKELMMDAKYSADLARQEAEELVKTDKSKGNIKAAIREAINSGKEVDITAVVEQKIREKAFSLAVDNLLLGRSINEAANLKNFDTWEGQIIEDSYKILRDNLVESAYQILYDDLDILEQDEMEDEDTEEKEEEKEEEAEEKEEATEEGLDYFAAIKQRILGESEKKSSKKCKSIEKDIASFSGYQKKCNAQYPNNPEKKAKCIATMKDALRGLLITKKKWGC